MCRVSWALLFLPFAGRNLGYLCRGAIRHGRGRTGRPGWLWVCRWWWRGRGRVGVTRSWPGPVGWRRASGWLWRTAGWRGRSPARPAGPRRPAPRHTPPPRAPPHADPAAPRTPATKTHTRINNWRKYRDKYKYNVRKA